MTFDNDNQISMTDAQIQIEQRVREIMCWMQRNKFRLNSNKIEFFHFCPDHKHNRSDLMTAFEIGSDIYPPAGNLEI